LLKLPDSIHEFIDHTRPGLNVGSAMEKWLFGSVKNVTGGGDRPRHNLRPPGWRYLRIS
jgi:hypothetical protein